MKAVSTCSVTSTFLLLFLLDLTSKAQVMGNSSSAAEKTTLNNSEDHIRSLSAPQFSETTRHLLVFPLFLSAIVAVLSNSLIIHVVRVNLHMRSNTNYLIVNMAFGDLLGAFFYVAQSTKYIYSGLEWIPGIAGKITCKLTCLFNFVALFCSIYSLVAISFDRFMAVSRPLTYKYRSRWPKYMIPVLWLTIVVISISVGYDYMEIRVLPNNKTYCTLTMHPQHITLIILYVYFIIPHVAMVILYAMIGYKLWTRRVPGEQRDAQRQNVAHQTAKKVIYMIICVFIVFEICYAPIFLYVIAGSMFYLLEEESMSSFDREPSYLLASGMVFMCNGLFNALIYAAFNENFRLAFKATLKLAAITLRCNTLLNAVGAKNMTNSHSLDTVNIEPSENRAIALTRCKAIATSS